MSDGRKILHAAYNRTVNHPTLEICCNLGEFSNDSPNSHASHHLDNFHHFLRFSIVLSNPGRQGGRFSICLHFLNRVIALYCRTLARRKTNAGEKKSAKSKQENVFLMFASITQ